MTNARTIAALERSITQLTKVKDRLSAADAKAAGSPAKKSATKKTAGKRTMTPEHRASISAAQRKRFALIKNPAKKGAAKKSAATPGAKKTASNKSATKKGAAKRIA